MYSNASLSHFIHDSEVRDLVAETVELVIGQVKISVMDNIYFVPTGEPTPIGWLAHKIYIFLHEKDKDPVCHATSMWYTGTVKLNSLPR